MPNIIRITLAYFRKGRHHRNRFSITVDELVAESKRIPIADVFAMRDEVWARRGFREVTVSA